MIKLHSTFRMNVSSRGISTTHASVLTTSFLLARMFYGELKQCTLFQPYLTYNTQYIMSIQEVGTGLLNFMSYLVLIMDINSRIKISYERVGKYNFEKGQ